MLTAAETGPLDTKDAADHLAPLCALAGLVLWLGIRILVYRPPRPVTTRDP